MRYLFRKGLEVNYRSRYVHLSWAIFERDQGNVDNARELFRRGHTLNPQDAPLLQVPPSALPTPLPSAPAHCARPAFAAHNGVCLYGHSVLCKLRLWVLLSTALSCRTWKLALEATSSLPTLRLLQN